MKYPKHFLLGNGIGSLNQIDVDICVYSFASVYRQLQTASHS